MTLHQDAPTATGDRPSSTLDALFRPRGAVVVGASSDPTKLGGTMAASLRRGPVPTVLVNARGGDGMHRTITEAVSAAAEPVDLAVLCVPAHACAGAITEAGSVGVRAALICAGGFAEVGPEGEALQRELAAAAEAAGVRLLGPNTSGFFAPPTGLLASFVPGVADIRPGGVGVVAASGGLNHALAFALDRAGSGVSLGVGIGAGDDVAAPEVLEHLAADPDTAAIALHLETVSDGDALLAAVTRAARTKPVVAMVVGRGDVGDFAASHTGALATSWRTTRALLRQAGAVVVDDVDALVTASSVLSLVRLPAHPGPRAALITAQAGPGLITADALHAAGIALPRLGEATIEALGDLLPPMTYQANPVDTGRPGPTHGRVVTTVATDESIDVTAVYALAEPVVDLVSSVESASAAGLPVVIGVDGPAADVLACQERARAAGVPVVTGPGALATAVAGLAEDAHLRWVLGAEPVTPSTPVRPVEPREGGWTEAAAKDLLDRVGIRTPERRVRAGADEVATAVADLGAPVAVKASDAQLLHKSDVGGVRLGITTADEARGAYADIARATGAQEVLVEAMAPAGLDLIAAARRDPVFGPVVVVGVGGTAAEIYADIALATATAPTAWLERLPDELAASAVLDGHRGAPAVDRGELARVLSTLGGLLAASPDLEEVEVNPLRATAEGLIALDAVIVNAHQTPSDTVVEGDAS